MNKKSKFKQVYFHNGPSINEIALNPEFFKKFIDYQKQETLDKEERTLNEGKIVIYDGKKYKIISGEKVGNGRYNIEMVELKEKIDNTKIKFENGSSITCTQSKETIKGSRSKYFEYVPKKGEK